MVLKLLFTLLFKGLDVREFHYDVCEFAKHKRVSFSLSNKSSLPFTLIHSDIWRPSTIPTISGACWFISFVDDYP